MRSVDWSFQVAVISSMYIPNRGHFMWCETDNYSAAQAHSDPEGQEKGAAFGLYVMASHVAEKNAEEKCAPLLGVSAEPLTSFFPEIGPNANLLFRKVRRVFDPKGIYAPGKLVYTEAELNAVPGPVNEFREKFGLKPII